VTECLCALMGLLLAGGAWADDDIPAALVAEFSRSG
jgi:hypothetical protein